MKFILTQKGLHSSVKEQSNLVYKRQTATWKFPNILCARDRLRLENSLTMQNNLVYKRQTATRDRLQLGNPLTMQNNLVYKRQTSTRKSPNKTKSLKPVFAAHKHRLLRKPWLCSRS